MGRLTRGIKPRVRSRKEITFIPLKAAGLRRAEVAPATQAGLSNGVKGGFPSSSMVSISGPIPKEETSSFCICGD